MVIGSFVVPLMVGGLMVGGLVVRGLVVRGLVLRRLMSLVGSVRGMFHHGSILSGMFCGDVGINPRLLCIDHRIDNGVPARWIIRGSPGGNHGANSLKFIRT